MSEVKHTPGPWTVGCRYTQTGVYSARDTLVAETHGAQRNFERDAQIAEQDANARLIASAPDLLTDCQTLLSLVVLKYGNLDPDVNVIIERARGNISKAKGDV